MFGRLRAIVDDNVRFVEHTLRKAGVREADIDDEIQRTFMVVARRLDCVRFGCERSFVYQVAINRASHARRTRARHRQEVLARDEVPEQIAPTASPETVAHCKQMGRLVDRVVTSMDERDRAVFTLHDIQEMSMSEIAAVLRVPRGTVASRLRRARAQFRKRVTAIQRRATART